MTSVYTTGRKKVPRYTLLTPEVVGNRLVNERVRPQETKTNIKLLFTKI